MKIKSISILIIAVFFVFIGYIKNVQAQNEVEMKPLSERIDDFTKKLHLKLLLTKEQLALVHNILSENISESTLKGDRAKVLKVINEKIEAALTNKQKSKFSILKSKWLDEIIGGSE